MSIMKRRRDQRCVAAGLRQSGKIGRIPNASAGNQFQVAMATANFAAQVECRRPLAATNIPQPKLDQLKEGGRMIIPVGEAGDQQLYLLEKRDGEIERTDVLDVRFVPMTGEAQDTR